MCVMEFDSVEFEELRNNTVSAISGISEEDTELLKNAYGEPEPAPEPVQPVETPEPVQPVETPEPVQPVETPEPAPEPVQPSPTQPSQ
jgi:outer membrane biosynthesis protein TonB